MLNLKIIYDPKINARWLVTLEGLRGKRYHGLLRLDMYKKIELYELETIKGKLIQLFTQHGDMAKEPQDEIQTPTLDDYFALEKLLKYTKCRYNKKLTKLYDKPISENK